AGHSPELCRTRSGQGFGAKNCAPETRRRVPPFRRIGGERGGKMDGFLKPAHETAPLGEGARNFVILAGLLVALAIVAACGQVTFNRETGQFSMPLGGGNGGGQGSNR